MEGIVSIKDSNKEVVVGTSNLSHHILKALNGSEDFLQLKANAEEHIKKEWVWRKRYGMWALAICFYFPIAVSFFTDISLAALGFSGYLGQVFAISTLVAAISLLVILFHADEYNDEKQLIEVLVANKNKLSKTILDYIRSTKSHNELLAGKSNEDISVFISIISLREVEKKQEYCAVNRGVYVNSDVVIDGTMLKVVMGFSFSRDYSRLEISETNVKLVNGKR